MLRETVIQNCTLAYKCPLRWDKLDAIGNQDDKRYCSECDTVIYKVNSMDDLRQFAGQKKCVYIEDLEGEDAYPGGEWMGLIVPLNELGKE